MILLELSIPHQPKAVTWMPDEAQLEWRWRDNTLHVSVPRLEIHGVVLIAE